MDAAHDQRECKTVAGIAGMAIALVFVLRLSATFNGLLVRFTGALGSQPLGTWFLLSA